MQMVNITCCVFFLHLVYRKKDNKKNFQQKGKLFNHFHLCFGFKGEHVSVRVGSSGPHRIARGLTGVFNPGDWLIRRI